MSTAGCSRKIVWAVQVVLALSCVSTAFGNSIEDMVARLRTNIATTQQYVLGDEVEFRLSPNQATNLICEENDAGVQEILIGWIQEPAEGDGVLYVYLVRTQGLIGGGGKAIGEQRGERTVVTGRENPCLNSAKWNIENGVMDIRFFASTRASDIQNAIKKRMPPLTADERTEIFVRAWSEIKYNFVNFDKVPELDWDKVLVDFLPLVREDQTNWEFNRLMTRCVAQLCDGHTSINLFDGPSEILNKPPIDIECVEGKAIVVALADREDIRQAGLALGMEITHVDGRPVQEILEKDIYPYICASTPQDRNIRAYPGLAEGTENSSAVLTIRDMGGLVRDVQLKRTMRGAEKMWQNEWASRGTKGPGWIQEGIYYMPLDTFGDKDILAQFSKAFDEIVMGKGLILDVRSNGGGNSGVAKKILSYLTDKPLETSHWRTRRYMPAFRAWGTEEGWHGKAGDPVKPIADREPFLGPIVVLIGPRTFSAAEDFLIPLHASQRATMAGQPTAGSTGQPLRIDFPGKGNMRICTKRDTYPDGREFVGIGVIPDILVQPTQADVAAGLYSNGADPVFDQGLELMKSLILKTKE